MICKGPIIGVNENIGIALNTIISQTPVCVCIYVSVHEKPKEWINHLLQKQRKQMQPCPSGGEQKKWCLTAFGLSEQKLLFQVTGAQRSSSSLCHLT